MSKIYLIGDSHIGLGYPNKTDKWFKIHQEYFSKFLIPLLKERVKLDHKISVYYGFVNNISPEEISDISNLCITKRFINSKKRDLIESEFKLN